ncbi:hypothetical protein D915_006489 [Fasciola hepatica]|uniref:Reverse transcriptase domain-containing protein n=1 Tax=Fasciola hepatica TaxID=6192 RepID=A0A4E0R7Q4_FASHE|nr:hypothetical protein D915_006489 [Fasciola hepatica]
MVEPIIPLVPSFCKPDLIVCCDDLVYVLDVCVVSGQSAESAWRTKVEKYSATPVEESIKRTLGLPTVRLKHCPVIISNRGFLFKRSDSGLRRLGLRPFVLARACQLVVEGSLKTYDVNEERIALVTSRTRRGTRSTPDDESLVRLANSTFQPGMLRKDLCATLTGFFDGRSAESIKKRLQFLHWSPPTSINLVEACEASPSVDSQHLPDMVDESADDWTQRLVSNITSGLASGPTGTGPWADLLGIITNWRDKVLDPQSARSALETLLAATFPHTWHSTPARTVRCVPTSKRDLLAYWKGIFSQPSHPDPRPVQRPSVAQWSVLDPILAREVSEALRLMDSTAPGLDRLTVRDLLQMDQNCIAQLLNALLVLRTPTQHLSMARVTLVPKCSSPTGPGDYRPIAVTSVVLRLLHKILARRWRNQLALSPWQMAFIQRDGCFEASTVLHTILRSYGACAQRFHKLYSSSHHHYRIAKAAKRNSTNYWYKIRANFEDREDVNL